MVTLEGVDHIHQPTRLVGPTALERHPPSFHAEPDIQAVDKLRREIVRYHPALDRMSGDNLQAVRPQPPERTLFFLVVALEPALKGYSEFFESTTAVDSIMCASTIAARSLNGTL